MVLETIVLSSAIGYIAGSVIGRGTTVTNADDKIKLVSVDIKEGYRKSMQDKNFRLMRDIAIASGVGYIYSRKAAIKERDRENIFIEVNIADPNVAQDIQKNLNDIGVGSAGNLMTDPQTLDRKMKGMRDRLSYDE